MQANTLYNIQKMLIISLTFFTLLINISRCSTQIYQQLSVLQNQIRQLQLTNRVIQAQHGNHNYGGQSYGCQVEEGMGCPRLVSEQYKKITFSELEISKQMQNNCQIEIKDTYQLFQSPRNAYIAINNKHKNSIELYNSQCHPIAQLKNIQLRQIFCDRGLCDDGTVVILTESNSIVLCTEMRNFTDCSMLASLENVVKERIVGGAVRNKGNGNIQVYIADSSGQVIVLDGQGKLRLTVSLESDSKISHFLDMHPYPIIISSKGWLYTFQNTKYIIALTRCPYLFHPINKAFMSHPYSSFVFLMSQSVITKLQFKTQPKGCEINHQFYLNSAIDQLRVSSQYVGLAEYQGRLYIGNKILNVEQKTVQQFVQCGNDPVFNFQQMKNNYRKGFFTIKCTLPDKNQQSLLVFKAKNPQQGNSKNNTIIMVIILFLVIFLIFLFLRSTTPNLDYDEELKYNHNMRYKMEVDQLLINQKQSQQDKIKKMKKEDKEKTKNQSENQKMRGKKDK